MDYQKIYNNLITKRQNEILPENVYSEKHHIIPKCVGGNNDKENLVRLTAREHYIAHILLAKIYNTFSLYSAVTYMQTGRIKNRKFKFNSRLYQKIREETSNKRKGFKYSEESRKKMSDSHKGITVWNKGTKGIVKAWNKGKKLSEEHKRKLSESLKGNKRALGHKLSTESKQKMSEKLKGHIPWNKGLVGKHWFNNGVKNILTFDCPEGFVKGRLKRKSI